MLFVFAFTKRRTSCSKMSRKTRLFMDHYEISESGRPDRLSRQALARSCGVSLSIGAPLPGCSWLAALRVHALRNGLQRSDKRGVFKTHEKVGFKQVFVIDGE